MIHRFPRPGRKAWASSQGSVLAEFVIIMPFVSLLLIGAAEMGKAFSEQSRLNQTVFEVTRRTAGLPTMTAAELNSFGGPLLQLHNRFIESSPLLSAPSYSTAAGANGTSVPLVNISTQASLNSMMQKFFKAVNVDVSAPYLAATRNINISPEPQNGSRKYKCSGIRANPPGEGGEFPSVCGVPGVTCHQDPCARLGIEVGP